MIIQASLITWLKIYKTDLCLTIKNACKDFDIDIKELPLYPGCDGNQHFKMISSCPNVISWVCLARSEDEVKTNSNVLFFDKDLLDVNGFYYFDDNGYGVRSNIVSHKYNNKSYPDSYVSQVYDSLKIEGWPILHGCKKDGPIMIALQDKLEDEELIRKCKKYLPKKSKVVIRGGSNSSKFLQNSENWELDHIDNDFDSLSRCSSLVVNSNNIMFKALAMGIPVASCSRWFHSGTSAVFDCSRNESLLKYILDFRFNEKSSRNLICAIRENSISKNIVEIDELLRNSNFSNWLKRIILV